MNDQTKPASDISCGRRCREVADGLVVIWERINLIWGYTKTSEIYLLLGELKLFGVQYDHQRSKSVSMDSVVDDTFQLCRDCIKPSVVAVTRGEKTLRGFSCGTL